jgi:SAM-dependent methyltransferase
MGKRVCPWWLGYLLASPLRRLLSEAPRQLLAPYVREGMTVLEPGPGMGFFTLDLARLAGSSGRVIAVEIQPRMLSGLKRRAARAGVLDRIEARLVGTDSMGLTDLAETVDFTLAFAVVHEMPDAASFFAQVAAASKSGAQMIVAEPVGHVSTDGFDTEMQAATAAGFVLEDRPRVRRSHAALLSKR